jgi:flagellin
MSVINTNVSALVAQSALTANSRAQSTAMQQLSTGLRINGAKDDAAGLAIASKMTSQIRGLDQAVRNANDGISLLQTADGAMTAVSDMLQRMRELAVQASNDTNVTSDRQALNTEYQALTTEIGRVGSTTQWNGMNILDGSKAGGFTFQVGANNTSAQRITQSIPSIAGSVASAATETITQTTPSTAAVAQVTTIAIGGTPAAGDKISLKLNGTTYDYTVTTADMSAGTPVNSIATNMFNTMKTAALNDASVTITNGTAGSLTLTGGAINTPFTVTASDSGGLSLLGAASDITSASNANAAITAVDGALSTINTTRADFGATINRLTYAADNLTNVSQNTSASRSRIQDTDYAKSSTELARTQIISQAATAMLAQANQSQQSVLALLK